jgi:hypothetical protein
MSSAIPSPFSYIHSLFPSSFILPLSIFIPFSNFFLLFISFSLPPFLPFLSSLVPFHPFPYSSSFSSFSITSTSFPSSCFLLLYLLFPCSLSPRGFDTHNCAFSLSEGNLT